MTIIDVELQTEELRDIANRRNLLRLPDVKLSKSERQLFSLLMRRDIVSRESAWTVLYAGKPEVDRASDKNIDVMISHVRKKLRGIAEIKTDFANGWFLERATKVRLQDMIDREMTGDSTAPVIGPIERGIPVPHRLYSSMYPLAQMQPGDSFLVTNTEDKKVRAAVAHFRIRSAGAEEHRSWKFTVKKIAGGVRVWRVK